MHKQLAEQLKAAGVTHADVARRAGCGRACVSMQLSGRRSVQPRVREAALALIRERPAELMRRAQEVWDDLHAQAADMILDKIVESAGDGPQADPCALVLLLDDIARCYGHDPKPPHAKLYMGTDDIGGATPQAPQTCPEDGLLQWQLHAQTTLLLALVRARVRNEGRSEQAIGVVQFRQALKLSVWAEIVDKYVLESFWPEFDRLFDEALVSLTESAPRLADVLVRRHEKQSYRAIGDSLGVSDTTASKLHRKALLRIACRAKMQSFGQKWNERVAASVERDLREGTQ